VESIGPATVSRKKAIGRLRRVRFNRAWGIVISVLRARYGDGIARDPHKDVLSDRTADPAASVLVWSDNTEVAGEQ
jgi:hypothetical protein